MKEQPDIFKELLDYAERQVNELRKEYDRFKSKKTSD